jgi:alcohol dehydrogenase
MLPMYYEFLNSVKILSGKNAIENIPFELKNLGAKSPIILTNDMLVKFGLVQIVLDSFKDSKISVNTIYENIPPDSSIKVINEIAEIYKKNNCDSIIAIGGGSVIDTAKGVGIVITENTDDIINLMGAEMLQKRRIMPFIAVPTTSGTGSEATLVAVIANPEKNVKMEFISYHLLPDVAVLDARMTKSLPARMTASTGIDAMVHAIEGYTCIQKNPLSDAYSTAAIRLIIEYLPEVVKNGSNEEARLAMANASLMAGISFSNSMVGIVHAIGHACGGVCHVPHGDAMAILLPYGMEYNMDEIGDLYGELLLSIAGAEVFAETKKEDRGQKTLDSIKKLLAEYNKLCGLPTKLSDCGVKKEDLASIAKTALNDGAIIMNPKGVTLEDVINILSKAY